MPLALNLPGYYFDQHKNRYFPLSSPPKSPPAPPHTDSDRPLRVPPSKSQRQRTSRDAVVWSTLQTLSAAHSHSQREHAIHAIQASQIASTSRREGSLIAYGLITSFCSTKTEDQVHRFLGDDRGWLYSSPPTEADHSYATDGWVSELNLERSPISSICASGSRCVATIFSPVCKIFVQDLNVSGTTYILNIPPPIRDIRSSHLQGRDLVLGAATQAVYLQDVETARSPRCLVTHSDVFAVHQQQHLVYAGTRNGSIHRFDVREDKSHGQKLFDGRFKKQRSSVLYINIIRDWQLLTSHMDGDLATFDLRFARESTPILKFPGHVNSNTERLGIAVDPAEDFLFAAGQDCRIRAWSLRTAQPLPCPAAPPPATPLSSSGPPAAPSAAAMDVDPAAPLLGDQCNPLRAVFGRCVQAMQVTDEREGMVLWAASEENLFKYHLGQRM